MNDMAKVVFVILCKKGAYISHPFPYVLPHCYIVRRSLFCIMLGAIWVVVSHALAHRAACPFNATEPRLA